MARELRLEYEYGAVTYSQVGKFEIDRNRIYIDNVPISLADVTKVVWKGNITAWRKTK